MTVTGTLILDGMGVGKLLVTEGFGPVSAYAPIMIEITHELSEIISAIPGPLEPVLVGDYINRGTFTVEIKDFTPVGVGVVTLSPADIIVAWKHPESSIEQVLGITAPRLWEIVTTGLPMVLTVNDSGVPVASLADISTPTMVVGGYSFVPSITNVEDVS